MTPEVATLALRDLEYIIAIAEYKNFRLASKACAVSQPALSGQIKKVEQALDIQIFERTNREVLVTIIGEQIVEQCRTILEELEILGSIARGADKPLSGPFRLGVIASLSLYLMPQLLQPLGRSYPALELVLRESVVAELLEALRIGKLDAVLASIPLPAASGNFYTYPLFKEPLVVALNESNRLAKKSKVSRKALDLDNMVLLDEQHSLTQKVLSLVETPEMKFPPQPTFTTSIESLCFMVAGSDKHGVVPLLASKVSRNIKELAFRSFSRPAPKREVGLIWRPRFRGAQALKEFAPKLQEMIGKLNPELELV